jgi:hypothetical protein
MGGERDQGDRLSGEPLEPSALPEELAFGLRTDHGLIDRDVAS